MTQFVRPRRDEQPEPSEYLASRSRHNAVPNSRDANQILSPIISDNDGAHSVCENDYNSRDCLDGVLGAAGPSSTFVANSFRVLN